MFLDVFCWFACGFSMIENFDVDGLQFESEKLFNNLLDYTYYIEMLRAAPFSSIFLLFIYFDINHNIC